jgi:hypothetical protein
MRWLILASLPLLLSGRAYADTPRRPMLAVMTLTDRTRTLPTSLVEGLTDALRSRLAQSGKFIVIDKSRQATALKQLVTEQKRESYKECYSSSCQIPLGQALAADSILRTKLTRVGSYYLLIAELVDLAKEAVTNAAQARVRVRPAGGRDDRLLVALSSLVRQLTGAAPAGGEIKILGALGTGRGGGGVGVGILSGGASPQELERRRALKEERRRQREAERRRQRAEWRQRQEESRKERLLKREEAERKRRIDRARAQVVRARRTRLVYGWMAVISGGILGATGVYYMTDKVFDDAEAADAATSPEALRKAADDASKHRVTGIVLTSLGAAAAGAGLYLIFSAPSLRPVKVVDGGLELQPLPRGGPTAGGGFALAWGGRF